MGGRVADVVLPAEPALKNESAAGSGAAVGGSTPRLDVDRSPSEPDGSPFESSNAGEITRAVLGS